MKKSINRKGGSKFLSSPKTATFKTVGKIPVVSSLASIGMMNTHPEEFLLLQQAKHMMKELGKREKDFRAVAENAPDVICRFDRQFRLLYVNPAIEKATGIAPHIFIGKNPLDIGMPKSFVDYWNKHVQFVFSTTKQTTLEFTFPTPQGEKYFQSLVVPEFDDSGAVETVLSISRDITEIKNVEKQKDEFISIASHELKTPLTSMRLNAQYLEKRLQKKGNKKDGYFIKNIVNQTEKLTNLVNSLLNVGRIETGKLDIEKKPFDINTLIRKIVIEFQLTTESHQITLEGMVSKQVYGDEHRVEQVLVNLITNAIKYSPSSDEIIIRIQMVDGKACISVQDFGIGISKNDQKKIFERFFRSNDAENYKVAGFGLGLYISSEIVMMHNGKIWVESKKGKGSTFYFTLPVKHK